MSQIQDALKDLDLSNVSITKFLKGFPLERSSDKGTLFIPISNIKEQKMVLNLLSLLDKHIQTNNPEKYITPNTLVVPYARELIEKLETNGASVKLDSSKLVEALQRCMQTGAEVRYVPSNALYPQEMLVIRSVKSVEEFEQIESGLHGAGISILRRGNYTYKSCEQDSSNALTLYGETAVRIIDQLIEKNIKFENKDAYLRYPGRVR